MRLLLDTHSFLWFIGGSDRLSDHARELIEDLENDLLLSVGSLWEIVIKVRLGKLKIARSFEDLIPAQLKEHDIAVLGIDMEHLIELNRMPLLHRDPFDRLLIAQAAAEGLPIVGRDEIFKKYEVRLLW